MSHRQQMESLAGCEGIQFFWVLEVEMNSDIEVWLSEVSAKTRDATGKNDVVKAEIPRSPTSISIYDLFFWLVLFGIPLFPLIQSCIHHALVFCAPTADLRVANSGGRNADHDRHRRRTAHQS